MMADRRTPDDAAQSRVVLVVDDDAALRETLDDLLTDAGYSVVAAGDGCQGLERLADTRPDVVLLDLMMPRMDGETFLSEARSRGLLQGVPVVLMTAAHNPADRALALGLSDWVSKPFDCEEVAAILEHAAGPVRDR